MVPSRMLIEFHGMSPDDQMAVIRSLPTYSTTTSFTGFMDEELDMTNPHQAMIWVEKNRLDMEYRVAHKTVMEHIKAR